MPTPSKSITGGLFQDPLGNLVTGNLLLILSQDAQVTGSNGQIAPKSVRIPVAAGSIASTPIWFNDQLTPSGTVYAAAVYDAAGNKVYGPENWSIQGASPIDIGTIIPIATSPLTSFPAPVLLNPSAPQTITGQALTLSASTPLTIGGGFTLPLGQTGTVNGALTVSGTGTFKTLNGGAIVFADQFSGSDASAKIQAAITALPAAGGTVDARALTDVGGTGSTVIDPGAKSVTLLLGPYTYQIQQLVLETNFHVIGAGMGAALGAGAQPTVLQACSTCAAINTVVLGTNGGNGGPIQHAYMEGLRIYGATSDTAIGMNLKTVNGAGTGLWYSTFRNLCVGACAPSGPGANGFSGGAISLDAQAANTINQFLDFYNVQAFKTNGGSPALSILGTNGQMNFIQCEFDGTTRNDGATVLQIVNGSGNGGPYSLIFNGATVQHGTTGINIAGASNITFIGTHFELVGQAITVNSGVGGITSSGITFIGSTCQNFCGNNSGTGWFAKTTTPSAVSATFIKNVIQSTVDATYIGFTNVTSMGDESDAPTTTTLLAANIPRIIYRGTQLTTGAFSFGGNWGTGPSFTSVTGTDGAFILTLSSGSGAPAANPTVNLNFVDGTWGQIPVCTPVRQDASAPTTAFWVQSNSTTATQLFLAFIGTPAVSTSYTVGVICSGKPN